MTIIQHTLREQALAAHAKDQAGAAQRQAAALAFAKEQQRWRFQQRLDDLLGDLLPEAARALVDAGALTVTLDGITFGWDNMGAGYLLLVRPCPTCAWNTAEQFSEWIGGLGAALAHDPAPCETCQDNIHPAATRSTL